MEQPIINSRTEFEHSLADMHKMGRSLVQYALLYVDIKSFHTVNELFGTEEGNRLLDDTMKHFATSPLKPVLSCHLGADRFAFLVSEDAANHEVLKNALQYQWKVRNEDFPICFICGVYNITDGEESASVMLDKAILAHQWVDVQVNEKYAVYDEKMQEYYLNRLEILASYEKALEQGEFEVYYQPIISVRTGTIASAEALVRWNHPEKGIIGPGFFIPVLEEQNLISKLDRYVLQHTVNLLKQRQEKGLFVPSVTMNLSWTDFYDSTLTEMIFNQMNDRSLPKDCIRFEMTERSYASLEQNRMDIINRIREYGGKFILDDFGSGYSSFAMMQSYNFDLIKLDQGFVRRLDKSAKAANIINGITAFCHHLGIGVVVEGVETRKELEQVVELGCDYIQGFYFSRPLAEKDFEKYLKKNTWY